MSGILSNRKLWLIILCVGIIIAVFMHLYLVSSILLIFLLLYIYNYYVIRHSMKALADLTPQRPIRYVETLVIGDLCTTSTLASKYDLNKTLIITAPGRSIEASFQILRHVASRLDGNNVCIVLPNRGNTNIGALDIPFLSSLTLLEMGIKDQTKERKFFLFCHPFTTIRSLLGLLFHPKQVNCGFLELDNYCQHKGYQLTIIKKRY